MNVGPILVSKLVLCPFTWFVTLSWWYFTDVKTFEGVFVCWLFTEFLHLSAFYFQVQYWMCNLLCFIDVAHKNHWMKTVSMSLLLVKHLVMYSRLLKTTYHKKHGADRICFTHHPSSVICSSRYNLDSTGGKFLYNAIWLFWLFIPRYYLSNDVQLFLRQNHCGICQCMIIDAFATSKAIKRGRSYDTSGYCHNKEILWLDHLFNC